MARYTVTEAAFIGGRLLEAGDTVEVADDVRPGPHMLPAKDDKGREDKAARAAKDKAAETQMPAPGDPRYIGDLIAHNIGDGRTLGRVDASSTLNGLPTVVVDADGVVRGIKMEPETPPAPIAPAAPVDPVKTEGA